MFDSQNNASEHLLRTIFTRSASRVARTDLSSLVTRDAVFCIQKFPKTTRQERH